MSKQRPSRPQGTLDVESAMALVCTLPAAGRDDRRAGVRSVINQATSSRELECGVAFSFENRDDIARLLLDLVLAERNCCAQFTYAILFEQQHRPIELRIEAREPLVRPLKDLYVGLLPSTGNHGQDAAE